MTAFVVDANVMNMFQHERVAGKTECGCVSVEKCVAQGFIALDDQGHCQQEWLDCAEGAWPLALSDWIAEMMRKEAIRLFRFTCDSMHQELRTLGIPKKDHKWIRLARSSDSETILSDDIDLLDPKRKNSLTSSKLAKVKLSGKGPVQKHLNRKYGITVICPENFAKD